MADEAGFNKIKNRLEDKMPTVDESIQDVGDSTWEYTKEHYLWHFIAVVSLSLGATMFFIYFAGKYSIELHEVMFSPLFLPFLFYGWIKRKVHRAFMKQFARANHFRYKRRMDYSKEKGLLFNKGRNRKAFNLVEGEFEGLPLRLFNYKYTVGHGDTKRTYKHTVFSAEFNTQLPHMYLDSEKNSRKINPKDLKYTPLEAKEFNDRYSLYITEGQHITALRIFEPDFMAELIDLPEHFDIEFIDNLIYISEDKLIQKKKKLREMFKIANDLFNNLAEEVEAIKVNNK